MMDNKRMYSSYFWNIMGSGAAAFSSVVLLIVVSRIMGAYVGGIYSFAYAMAQQWQTVGAYDMRTYQVTDVGEVYSFGTYYASRILTCTVMLVGAVVFAFLHGGPWQEICLLILVAGIKLFDAAEDVFHGMFQQHDRLDWAGQALFFRTLVTTVVFVGVLYVVKDILLACMVAIVASAIALYACNIPRAKTMTALRPNFQKKPLWGLLKACFPLFLASFLLLYLYNAPKYSIERFLSKEYQTYYSALFMPASVINLFGGFAFKPLLTTLAKSWRDRQHKRFTGILLKGMGLCVGITVFVEAAAYFLGAPVLSWLYGISLHEYRTELLVLLAGGGISALNIILYNGLTVMRRQKAVLWAYAITVVLSFLFSDLAVRQMGITGAVVLYLGLMAAMFLLLTAATLYYVRRPSPKGNTVTMEKKVG